jgi:hypothetical protein
MGNAAPSWRLPSSPPQSLLTLTTHCSQPTSHPSRHCGAPCTGTFWYALAALRLASCKIASVCRRFRPEYKSIRSAANSLCYRHCPIGRRHPVGQRTDVSIMAANSRHRSNPHDFPTSVLLSPRKYSSSRCTGLVQSVFGPRITTPKQYLIRSKGISTSTYRPWIFNPSFSTRHTPGAPQTKIDESPELLKKSKIRRMWRRWTPAAPSPSATGHECNITQSLRGLVQVQEPRVGSA